MPVFQMWILITIASLDPDPFLVTRIWIQDSQNDVEEGKNLSSQVEKGIDHFAQGPVGFT